MNPTGCLLRYFKLQKAEPLAGLENCAIPMISPERFGKKYKSKAPHMAITVNRELLTPDIVACYNMYTTFSMVCADYLVPTATVVQTQCFIEKVGCPGIFHYTL